MIQHGISPYIECSSRGTKEFSAFAARIRSRGNRTIEEIYQAAKVFENGETNLHWRKAKGRKAINAREVRKLYSTLWDEYILENIHLVKLLVDATGLSDMFGQEGHACQATELWRIREKFINMRNMFGAI